MKIHQSILMIPMSHTVIVLVEVSVIHLLDQNLPPTFCQLIQMDIHFKIILQVFRYLHGMLTILIIHVGLLLRIWKIMQRVHC